MKNAFDGKHVKGVSAIALLWEGKEAGKIIANWSDNPAGSVCTATVSVWAGSLKDSFNYEKNTARARGYGYDKLASCLERILQPTKENNEGREYFGGKSSAFDWLRAKGYQVIEVI